MNTDAHRLARMIIVNQKISAHLYLSVLICGCRFLDTGH